MERAKEQGMQLSWITAKREELTKLLIKEASYCIGNLVLLFVYVCLIEFEYIQNTVLFWVISLAILAYAGCFLWIFYSQHLKDRKNRCVQQIRGIENFLAGGSLPLQEFKELDHALAEFENGVGVIFTGEGNLKLTDHFMLVSHGKYAVIDVIKVDTICGGACDEKEAGQVSIVFYDADGRGMAPDITLSGEALDKKEQIINEIREKYGQLL